MYTEYFLEEKLIDEWNIFLFFRKGVENNKDPFSNQINLTLSRIQNSLYLDLEYKYLKNLDPILTIERYSILSSRSSCCTIEKF